MKVLCVGDIVGRPGRDALEAHLEDLIKKHKLDFIMVNAENAELVVLTVTGQLMLVTGDDIILQDTFVDVSGFVFFEGFPFGIINFAEDGDGFRTLWWTTLLGSVIHIDEFTAIPSVSTSIANDFIDVPCDATPFWDGCLVNTDCDDNNVCTLDVCNGGVCVHRAAIAACDDGNACTTFDACINGVLVCVAAGCVCCGPDTAQGSG